MYFLESSHGWVGYFQGIQISGAWSLENLEQMMLVARDVVNAISKNTYNGMASK